MSEPVINRRVFLATSALAAIACTEQRSPAVDTDASSAPMPRDTEWQLFVGTYTKTGTSQGIYRTTVNARTLAFAPFTVAAACADPSYLALTPNRRTLLAVNELTTFNGEPSGSVTAFAYEAENDTLTAASPVRASRGGAPCYVHVDRTGRYALVANYVGGSIAVLHLQQTGELGDATTAITFTGRGPNAARQESPHAHCIVLDKQNHFAYVSDLGTDRIYIFRFDATTGALTEADTPSVSLAPGAGPRHLAFSSAGDTLYCVNELDNTLVVFSCDPSTGALTAQHVVSTRPPVASGENAPADLHVHPTLGTVYLSNRGDNTVAVFSIDAASRRPTLVQTIASGGNWPRNFTLTPDGTGLLVAHQRSDSIVAFRIDAQSGQLSAPLQTVTTPVPVCLLFA